jgi:3-oxoacyl-[acyl-carrier protein] reductase
VFSKDALAGEVILVTGASRGIGHGVLEALALAGATVIGTATSEAGLEAIELTRKHCAAAGRAAVLDVRDGAAGDALIESIGKEYGKLSVLVNNAGITRDALAMRMKDEDWDAVIDTDLTALFRLSRAAMRGMIKARHGRIINVTSVVGSMGNAGQANYAAAKAGVAGMTRALARELGGRGVTVNCVAPGFIETDMTRGLTEQQTSSLLTQIPLGRLGRASDVAAAVVFLASRAPADVTRATLHVNGGKHMS